VCLCVFVRQCASVCLYVPQWLCVSVCVLAWGNLWWVNLGWVSLGWVNLGRANLWWVKVNLGGGEPLVGEPRGAKLWWVNQIGATTRPQIGLAWKYTSDWQEFRFAGDGGGSIFGRPLGYRDNLPMAQELVTNRITPNG
jgi:hypothetical protein